jgi:hypothetical protein
MAGGLGGTVGKMLGGGGAACKNGGIKVPLQIHGTTSSPQFVPDIGGAAASLLKSEFSCAESGGAGGLTNAAGALAGGSKGSAADTINQLGGLFGKKKP